MLIHPASRHRSIPLDPARPLLARGFRPDRATISAAAGCVTPCPGTRSNATPGSLTGRGSTSASTYSSGSALTFLLDLVHFGVPTWLPDAFADAGFSHALERFARAFGGTLCRPDPDRLPDQRAPDHLPVLWRHRSLAALRPRTEQLHDRAVPGRARLLPRHPRAARNRCPACEILVSDSLEVAVTYEDSDETTSPFLRESLRADVARRMHRRHIVTDLILGRVDGRHPLAAGCRSTVSRNFDLHWFQRNAQTLDIIGLDYYEHTEVELYTTPGGLLPPTRAPARRWGCTAPRRTTGIMYHIPLMITETSVGRRTMAIRSPGWKTASRDVRRLRAEGFPVVGYTWWPVHRPPGLGWRIAAPDRAHSSRRHLPARTPPRRPARTCPHRPARRLPRTDCRRQIARRGRSSKPRRSANTARPGPRRRTNGGPGAARLAHHRPWHCSLERCSGSAHSTFSAAFPAPSGALRRTATSGARARITRAPAWISIRSVRNLFTLSLHLPAALEDDPNAAGR